MPASTDPDGEWHLGWVRDFLRMCEAQDVQDVQAPSAQAVTGEPQREDRGRPGHSPRTGRPGSRSSSTVERRPRKAEVAGSSPASGSRGGDPFTWDCGPADWREAWEAWARR